MQIIGHFFPEIHNLEPWNTGIELAKNSVKYMQKEPIKGTVIIGTIAMIAYKAFQQLSPPNVPVPPPQP